MAVIIPPVATKKLTRGKIAIKTKKISTNKKNWHLVLGANYSTSHRKYVKMN